MISQKKSFEKSAVFNESLMTVWENRDETKVCKEEEN